MISTLPSTKVESKVRPTPRHTVGGGETPIWPWVTAAVARSR